MKKALIFQGGWEGHEPAEVAEILAGILREENFDVKITDTLETLEKEDLTVYDLIVPNWTQGTITDEQLNPLLEAVPFCRLKSSASFLFWKMRYWASLQK